MKLLKSIFIISLFIAMYGCKEDKVVVPEVIEDNTEKAVSTFYFIRHAEKDRSDKTNRDPELNQDGLGRAVFWAEVFSNIKLDAVYSTDYERTRMTAAPTAVQQEIVVQYYDPSNINGEKFKMDNLGKKVLVVGHSNTTPHFVNKVVGEKLFPQMQEDDNSSLFVVTVIGDQATASQLNINVDSP